MRALSFWFEKQARRADAAVYLEDGMLGGRFTPYVWYRLRYFVLRYVTATVLHGIVVLLLSSIYSQRAFLGLVFAHALAGLISTAWWGALEELRGRVRHLYRSGRPHLISEEIGGWLRLSLVLATAVVALALAWLGWHIVIAGHPFDSAALYALAIALGTALTFVTRTFHSGVYAIRRIYRPMVAIVAVQLVSFLAILALWPWLGAWSFPVATIASTLTTAALTFYYTARVYRFFDFHPWQRTEPGRARFPRHVSWKELFGAAASYGLMKLDSFLILGLFSVSAAVGGKSPLFVLFFAISPTIQAGCDWAQLFYFDLKRLELRPFPNLARRYERHLLKLSLGLGTLFWILGDVTLAVIYPSIQGILHLGFLPFFLSRSLLAYLQVRAFCARQYADLLHSAVICLVGILWIRSDIGGETAKLVAVAMVMVCASAYLWYRQRFAAQQAGTREPLGFTDWLARVRSVTEPVRLHVVRFAQEVPADGKQLSDDEQRANRWRHTRVAAAIARRMNGSALVTLLHPGRILWLESAGSPPALRREWLVARGGGMVQEVRETGVVRDGRAALYEAQHMGLLGNEFRAGRAAGSAELEAMQATFRRMFPKGVVYAPDRPTPPFLSSLASKDKRSILSQAVQFAHNLQPPTHNTPFDVTAFCQAGELRLLFLVDRRADRRLRSRWRAMVKRFNLYAAMDGAATA